MPPKFNPADPEGSSSTPYRMDKIGKLTPPSNSIPLVSSSPEPAPRFRGEIIGGLYIPYSKGRAWLKEKHEVDLPDDRSEDLSIGIALMKDFVDRDYGNRIKCVLPGDGTEYNLLVVTRWLKGEFWNTGPEGVEEILQDDLKDMLKPGEREEGTKKLLFQEFGIDADYKCFFVD